MEGKLRPCDCKDSVTASKLNEQGIAHNDESITIDPNVVIMTLGNTTIRISQARFRMFAEWYMEEQDVEF